MILSCSSCSLYGLQSKKLLKHLLKIKNNKLTKQKYIASRISPYINKDGKPRLIEPPKDDLKAVQKRLKKLLGQITVPDNIFSGVKGKSYVDNARMHVSTERRNLFKIDLSAFFPSIRRETVYRFFNEDMRCAPDVAQLLTNLTTVDLELSNASDLGEVYQFLNSKNVLCKNHLISGAPTSQILSYLVNWRMFNELQEVAISNHAIMTIYVDDIFFSSNFRISHQFTDKVISIVRKYGYQLSQSKVKKYTKLYPKLVTGVIIDPYGNPAIKNELRAKIIKEFALLREAPDNIECRQRLKGLLIAARQVDLHAFPEIYRFVYN